MGILKKIGLRTAKGCCFYPVSKDSAVLVAMKDKQGTSLTIPKRIGKYTVRGIDDPFCPGRIGDAYAALSQRGRLAVNKKLFGYKLLSEVNVNLLPSTVEYIGFTKFYGHDFGAEEIRIPPHVRYIRSMKLPEAAKTPTPLTVPYCLRYLGNVEAPLTMGYSLGSYYALAFYTQCAGEVPHLRLSDYLGYEVEEIPQIANNAFAKCNNLMHATIPKEITRIGAGAFANTSLYTLSLPEGLTHIDSAAFANCSALNEINLPQSLIELASDAFLNCPRLRLTPPLLEKLASFPLARDNMIPTWEKAVKAHVDAGDEILFGKHLTPYGKLQAYDQYFQALRLDPFHLPAVEMLNPLVLSYRIPNGSVVKSMMDLREYLTEHNSHDAVSFLDSTFVMLDSVCTILSDPEDIITQRHVYGLNCDQGAAGMLLHFLMDAIESHPRISGAARDRISKITAWILTYPTRNRDPETEKEFARQKRRHAEMFGSAINAMKRSNPISDLNSEHLLSLFREEMEKPNDAGVYDAEFWLELARTFNPKVEIPEKFTKMQARCRKKEEAEKWKARMQAITFPEEPILPTPSFTRFEESSFEMSDTLSEYWAGVAAKAEAEAIESLWCGLADIGFWDDTSWQ